MGRRIPRSLEDRIVETLKAEATRTAVGHADDVAEARARADRLRRGLEGRPYSDSAALIREDRDR